MCGRYALTLPPEAVRAWFHYTEQPNFPPRYNIAPTQPIPIVTRDAERPTDPDRHFRLVRWGLVPAFVRDFSSFPLLINARAEELAGKPSFRAALIRRRCLVIADAYYEWRREPSLRKGTPFLFRRADGRPIGLASLWERWMGADGSELDTACIITTGANASSAAVHSRMPVVLEEQSFDDWLDVDRVSPDRAAAMLRPPAEQTLDFFAIGPAVNKVTNDDPSIQQPDVKARTPAPLLQGRQGILF